MGDSVEFVKNLLLGGTSGCIAKTTCAPLERVKIVLQTQDAALKPGETPQYRGMLQCGRGIVQNQGVAQLWRGNFTNCVRYFPTQAIGFACKERYQKFFVRPKEEVGFWRWFAGFLAAGGAAGATALCFVYPLEFSYTRLAADKAGQFKGMGDVIKSINKKEGPIGLYRGFGPSVCGIVVYRAGYFGFYDVGKQMTGLDGKNANIFAKFGLALTVDIAAATWAYPIDTVRRRLMMQAGKPAAEKQYTNSLGCIKHIMANEGGVKGFYKGCFTNNVRAIASALVLVLYDELKKFI